MGLFGFGNKPLGTYPNGVPYDKRRYNPNHPNHLPPPQSSPAYGYPADAWMSRAPYTTTWDFQWSQRQNGGAGMGGVDTRGSRDMGNNMGAVEGMGPISGMAGAGSRRGSLAGAMGGMGPMSGMAGMSAPAAGSRRGSTAGAMGGMDPTSGMAEMGTPAAGSRRGSLAGVAGPQGAGPRAGPGTMPGSAEPRPGAMPGPVTNAAARPRRMGMKGPGAMRGSRGPFGSQRFGSRTGRRPLY